MIQVASRLRVLRPRIVERASHQLARGEGLRAVAAKQISRFYMLLEDAVESGSPEWLDPCLQDWVKARSTAAYGDTPLTFLPVLDVLKSTIWDVVQENCPAEEALGIILALEPGFTHAQSFLSVLEVEALMRETFLKLHEAQDNLRRLDKSKADFIAVAAHELKTPLTLIEGYADMLTEEVQGDGRPNAVFLLNGITKGIGRLKEIVEDMVDASMIDNNLLSLSFQPVRLLKVFEKVRTDIEHVLRERRLTFTFEDFPADEDVVGADPQRILQVFRHIVLNAVKYTPDGGRITISARRRPGFWEVLIADTGIGIAPEDQQRIFEKFSLVGDVALHSTSKTKFKGGGTGLGLAIVKGIIEAHGGAIWCESPGHDEKACLGTTFHIMIPEVPPVPEAARFTGVTESN